MKKRVKSAVKHVKKHSAMAIKIWRIIATAVIFIIITPLFLSARGDVSFFRTVLILSVLLCGLIIIIREAIPKKIINYVNTSMYIILLGAILILLTLGLPKPVLFLQIPMLVISSFSYSLGLQRLGLRYFFMVI